MSLEESTVVENSSFEETGALAETGPVLVMRWTSFCGESPQALTATAERTVTNRVRRKRCIILTVARVKGPSGAQNAITRKI